MIVLDIKTYSKTEFVEITAKVQAAIDSAGLSEGLCMLFVPHTTAAITINEHADPSVKSDILMVLNEMVPWQAEYRHGEGNSAAHIKSTLVGASELIAVEKGRLVLGRWQGIFFCEFDGPRSRRLQVTMIPA